MMATHSSGESSRAPASPSRRNVELRASTAASTARLSRRSVSKALASCSVSWRSYASAVSSKSSRKLRLSRFAVQ